MNNHIELLHNYFIKYSKDVLNKNLFENINTKLISIDFSSKSRRGNISSNFYLVAINKIKDKNFNFKDDLLAGLSNLFFVKNCEISKTGFINIDIKKEFLLEQIINLLNEKDKFGKSNFGKGKTINIEFVSANPTGPITVAHMRGAVLGDVISSLLINSGYKVTREYYVNNAGSQIDILGNSLYKRYLELFGKSIKLNHDEYPGKYLIEIAKLIKKEDGDKWIEKNSKETENYFKTYAVQYLINIIKKDLKLLNIKFDKFSFETDIVSSNVINDLFKILENSDLLYNGILEKPKGEDTEDWEPRSQLLFKSS